MDAGVQDAIKSLIAAEQLNETSLGPRGACSSTDASPFALAVQGDTCTLCGHGEELATDWVSCDQCNTWVHFSCDKRPFLGGCACTHASAHCTCRALLRLPTVGDLIRWNAVLPAFDG
jgi:hypothetical protein